MTPLNDREKRALTLWIPILAVLGLLDGEERGRGTFSEANRVVRRRMGRRKYRAALVLAALWWDRHIGQG